LDHFWMLYTVFWYAAPSLAITMCPCKLTLTFCVGKHVRSQKLDHPTNFFVGPCFHFCCCCTSTYPLSSLWQTNWLVEHCALSSMLPLLQWFSRCVLWNPGVPQATSRCSASVSPL
jgi:hypothetical protein